MKINVAATLLAAFLITTVAFGQNRDNATLRGVVTIGENKTVVPRALITILQLNRSTYTDEKGSYEFSGLPAGRYDVAARLERVPDVVKSIEFLNSANLDFQLSLSAISEQVTITATGLEEAVSKSYNSVDTIAALELSAKNPLSIGEALKDLPGVANRSFGPASGRPMIRGFDGDRVLVLQDGLRVGGISSQSGDEVEPIDVLSLDRVEVVKGPATLLYGSNAIGGVVDGISSSNIYQKGLSGYFTAFGGTNNRQAGSSGELRYGIGNFMIFGGGSGQRANDYRTPIGTVRNSYGRTANGSVGAGWFPRQGWATFKFGYDWRRYGLPVEPDEIDLEYYKTGRTSYEARGGFRELGGFIEGGDFAVNYNNYIAREFEFESDENITEFEGFATNKNFNYRANFNHRRIGKFAGTFGFSGFNRDFESVGAEAPAPRTRQNSFAVYGLERVEFERFGLQFGGRFEQNSYNPDGILPNRSFYGFSGSAGIRVPLWSGGSAIANYQHSFRAPALEELYNNGPHPGGGEFDIGNPNLAAEESDGIDFSVRHSSERYRFEASAFYYNLRNFVFPAFTGVFDEETNLPVVRFSQGESRYSGTELSAMIKILGDLWFSARTDYVRAELTDTGKPLPRISPLRASVGIDWRYKAFSIRPELLLAAAQSRVFDNESPTPGYTVFNLNASYTIISGRFAHVFALGGYNLGDQFYRNHSSFLKTIAPEIGRGVRLNYSVRF